MPGIIRASRFDRKKGYSDMNVDHLYITQPSAKRRKYQMKSYRFSLVIAVTILTIVGILVIGSANESFQRKQIAGLILGLAVMTVVSLIDYHYFLNLNWLLYAAGIGFLLMVIFFGESSHEATRWVDLGFIRFQPSELVKILMILFLAEFFSRNRERLSMPRFLIFTLVLIIVPVLLIYKQPDLSTSIVVLVLCMLMLFIAGISAKIVRVVVPTVLVAFTGIFYIVTRETQSLISEYQHLRIMSWLQPENYPQSAYQQQNSITAVGSGRLWGKGLNNTDVSSVKNGNFISEPQTDFIFAVTGEELGFAGCCLVIGLLLIIFLECMIIASKAKDREGKLIAAGMGILVSFQSFVNICVVTGLMPNTGLPLPFMSYGLTSLVTLFAGIGFVLNVGLQSNRT